jgi:hypothetical protein
LHSYVKALGDSQALEGTLEYFEVEEEVHFEIGLPLDLPQRHLFGVGSVEHLAVDVACPQLLDRGDVGDEQVVDPF